MADGDGQLCARLIEVALEWERLFGVAPQITSAISEYDAARLVGHSDASFSQDRVGRTAVSRGADFSCNGLRYQVKANRPSGKPGSPVTKVAKASNYDWDRLLWLLYDRHYVLQEAWEWERETYRSAFDAHRTSGHPTCDADDAFSLSPANMRLPPSASLKRPRVNARRYASELSNKLDAKNTTWESDSVTKAAQKLLDEFETLPDQDRSELFAELARRVALAPHDAPQDDDLVAIADRLFTELDRREPPE